MNVEVEVEVKVQMEVGVGGLMHLRPFVSTYGAMSEIPRRYRHRCRHKRSLASTQRAQRGDICRGGLQYSKIEHVDNHAKEAVLCGWETTGERAPIPPSTKKHSNCSKLPPRF